MNRIVSCIVLVIVSLTLTSCEKYQKYKEAQQAWEDVKKGVSSAATTAGEAVKKTGQATSQAAQNAAVKIGQEAQSFAPPESARSLPPPKQPSSAVDQQAEIKAGEEGAAKRLDKIEETQILYDEAFPQKGPWWSESKVPSACDRLAAAQKFFKQFEASELLWTEIGHDEADTKAAFEQLKEDCKPAPTGARKRR